MKKIKKALVLILTIIMVAALFAGCEKTNTGNTSDSSSQSSGNSLDKVKKAGVLKIGLEDSFPPMEFRDSQNKLVGFDVDMMDEVAKRLGVKTEYVSTDFNGIILALKSSKFDVIASGLSITEERKKEIAYSDPYLMGGQMIVVKKGNTSIKGSADLKGKTVGVELGATSEAAAKKIEGIKELKKYDKATEELQDLSIGRLDAVIVDSQVGGYYITQKKDQFDILSDQLTKEPMGLGFKKEDTDLRAAVQKALDDMKKDGTLSKLSVKWFAYDAYKDAK